MCLKRILQMTGATLIVTAMILASLMINDVVLEPFMEDSQSMLFFTIGTSLSTPIFCFIGGFILLGMSKLIDLQEKSNSILIERLDAILKNSTQMELEENESTTKSVHIDSSALSEIDDRKYWNG
ncbi:hypothetical protein PJ311_12810 [Bacillus sp. CLL-7-23]|uniref:Lipopolysaccharide assembly protein A domain-containing protein n=1 Tax=Bacillus changyiensis TaxID=3004103 RepID=A0ABT4X598_9BACI|nr:hypothetical protein [Bacillus changyiensis]MDA7027467.1 hypothetical protein [Bacillus changyiensis]